MTSNQTIEFLHIQAVPVEVGVAGVIFLEILANEWVSEWVNARLLSFNSHLENDRDSWEEKTVAIFFI